MPALPVLEPSRVTVMIKPVGALCNLDCTYCYYLPTKEVFGQEKRMSLQTLESVFAGMLPRFEQHVTIAWQGGEPTLAGLDFFKQAIELQKQYGRPGQTISNALQTNATLLDDDWCRFLKQYRFLVGVSIDGPPHLHDPYRVTNDGQPSAGAVLRGMGLLQKHRVDYNVLCVLNDRNVNSPDEVLSYLLNLGARFLQFIPAIEWDTPMTDPGVGGRTPQLRPFSPTPEQYGRFMCRVFDLWFQRYRKQVSVRLIDALLNKLVLDQMPCCVHDSSCHNQLTIEHDGSVFGCDHYVDRPWQLARIGHDPGLVQLTTAGAGTGDGEAERAPDAGWLDRVDTQRFGAFAALKGVLPEACLACEYKPLCHGGCPKHRPHRGEMPEPTILCEGYKMFYSHALPRLQWLASYLRRDQLPPDPDALRPRPAAGPAGRPGKVKPNTICPCGSGLKFKKCCGRKPALASR